MKTSDQIDKLAEALAKAQLEMKNPEKNRTAKIPTKSGTSYQYNYADLPSTLDILRVPLGKNGLTHMAALSEQESGTFFTVRLVHASGQWTESSIRLPDVQDPKSMAANITYFTRYLLNALVGVSGDEDLDSEPEHENARYEQLHRGQPTIAPQMPAKGKEGQTLPLPTPKGGLDQPKVKPLGLVGNIERDHIKALADKQGWPADLVVAAMHLKWGKKAVKEMTQPEYQELSALIGAKKGTEYEKEIEQLRDWQGNLQEKGGA